MELVALKKIAYNGKKYEPGETFNTSRKDGRVFIAIGKAMFPVTVIHVLEEPPAVEEEKSKRTYKRRDMTAER
jgi:hypothetical protein